MSKPTIIRQYGDTDFITTLRAIAATMVVIFHTNAFYGFGWVGANITETGQFGVPVFFVISGYTIAKTFLDAPNYRHFITRRLLRIAPLYYICISLGFILIVTGGMQQGGVWEPNFNTNMDAYNIVMHMTFLSFLDYRISFSIIGVEWSIPIEIFWYIFLPFVILRANSVRSFTLLMLAILAIDIGTRNAISLSTQDNIGFRIWVSPTTYGVIFMMGVAAYRIRKLGDGLRNKYRHLATFGGVLFVLTMALQPSVLKQIQGVSLTFAISTFLIIAFYKPSKVSRIFVAKPFLFIGSISYSIYLLHNIILTVLQTIFPGRFMFGFWTFVTVYALTIALSTLTYFTIEKPTNALGRRVADRYFGAKSP